MWGVVLDNDEQLQNSFAFRSGNAFIVSNEGKLLANFGSYKPPSSDSGGMPGGYSAQQGTTPLVGTGSLNGGTPFLDQPTTPVPFPGVPATEGRVKTPLDLIARPDFGTVDNPLPRPLLSSNTLSISSLTS